MPRSYSSRHSPNTAALTLVRRNFRSGCMSAICLERRKLRTGASRPALVYRATVLSVSSVTSLIPGMNTPFPACSIHWRRTTGFAIPGNGILILKFLVPVVQQSPLFFSGDFIDRNGNAKLQELRLKVVTIR